MDLMSQTIVAATTPATELTDEDIVERVRSGDIALYEILVRRHNQRLYRTIRAILRDDRDVEDVMQQAYVDAYTHLDQFRGTARFATTASNDPSGNGSRSAEACTAGAAPAGRWAIITADGSTAVTSRSRGS